MKIAKAQIKVTSSVFSDLVVLWFGAMLVTRDLLTLIVNGVLVIISFIVAVRFEKLLEVK
ncbi:MAG: hypothetical protein ABIJ43_00435 [Candidatus Beckwithbacteria bacterium]|nr:hypothetical protein [Patescibacteria group bacterium]